MLNNENNKFLLVNNNSRRVVNKLIDQRIVGAVIVSREVRLVIVLMITNTPWLEQGKQKYIYVIISFLYIQYVSDLFVCLILSDQNKS